MILIKDDLVLRDFLTKQITHLNIDIKKPTEICSKTVANIFELILSLCKKLIVLNFGDMFTSRQCETPIVFVRRQVCSTLMKLKINVVCFADCLFLLDGRLECLTTLIINVFQIYAQAPGIGGTVSIISMIMLTQKKSKRNIFL